MQKSIARRHSDDLVVVAAAGVEAEVAAQRGLVADERRRDLRDGPPDGPWLRANPRIARQVVQRDRGPERRARGRYARASPAPRMRASATRVFGVCWRRFMFGRRSVPPARSIASGPSPEDGATSATRAGRGSGTAAGASSAHLGGDRGAGLLVPLARRLVARAAVAALPGRRDLERLRPGHLGEARRAGRPTAPRASSSSAFRIFSGVIGISSTRTPDRVEDGVGQRRHDRQQRPLPDLLGAERPVRRRAPRRGRCRRRASPALVGLLYSSMRGELVHQRRRTAAAAAGGRPTPPSAPRRAPCRRRPRPARATSVGLSARPMSWRSRPSAPRASPSSGSTSTSTTAGGVGVGRRRAHAAALVLGGATPAACRSPSCRACRARPRPAITAVLEAHAAPGSSTSKTRRSAKTSRACRHVELRARPRRR